MFIQLFVTQLIIESQTFFSRFINTMIWVLCTLFIFGYLLQSFGMNSTFGFFMLAGIIGCVGFFEAYGNAIGWVSDFEGNRVIDFYLTLPISTYVIFFGIMSAQALVSTLRTFMLIPCGVLILWNQVDFSHTSWIKLLLIVIMANIFFTVVGLTMAAQAKRISGIRNLWMRYINPMWILGGFQFSWITLYNLNPIIGIISCINPMIYIMDGTRASLLGQEGFISWWICMGMLILFCTTAWAYSYSQLKKILDFVVV